MINSILIFGGTFDPVHNGHELFLKSAEKLCNPDLTLVVPCNIPPHKKKASAPDDIRAKMCEALCEGAKNAVVYVGELTRKGTSYTVDTINQLKHEYAGAKMYMCIGGDMLLYFRKWKDWDYIAKQVTLIVQNRDENDAQVRREASELTQLGADIMFTHTPPMIVASTQLREMIMNGQSIVNLVPKKVNEIIEQNNLYKR